MTQPLVGTWSSNNTGFYYTATEDVSLTLINGGSGQIAYSRPGYSEIAQLSWHVPSEGILELSIYDGRTTSGGRTVVSELHGVPSRVSYRIAEEDTRFNGRVPILRTDPPIMLHGEFGSKY